MNKVIQNKIDSYILQDSKDSSFGLNKKYLPKNYIDITDIKILLDIQKNKCYMCDINVKLKYESGCKNQFTCDRINGKNPHLKGNILIACWYCNCIGYNKQTKCKNNCCLERNETYDKNNIDIQNKIKFLLNEYNKKLNTNYTPNDDWIDYGNDSDGCINFYEEYYDSDKEYIIKKFTSKKAATDYYKIENQFKDFDNGYNVEISKYKNNEQNNYDIFDRCIGCNRHDDFCRCGNFNDFSAS